MNTASATYELYGLRVRSEIPLSAPLAQAAQVADLHISWGEPMPTPETRPDGEVLAELVDDSGRGYWLVNNGQRYLHCFLRTATFCFSRDLQNVTVHMDPRVDRNLAALFLEANTIATILALRGETVLHASAVEVDGQAIAFAGNSGAGKSTMAALLCAHGGRYITDDLLRILPHRGDWLCSVGPGHLRLRRNALNVTEFFPAGHRAQTADDRTSIHCEKCAQPSPLRAIVIPRPSMQHTRVEVARLAVANALVTLMACPRFRGLPSILSRQSQMDFLGKVAATVPVFNAIIPWGVPDAAQTSKALIDGVLGGR